jgi:hypothetical protein
MEEIAGKPTPREAWRLIYILETTRNDGKLSQALSAWCIGAR